MCRVTPHWDWKCQRPTALCFRTRSFPKVTMRNKRPPPRARIQPHLLLLSPKKDPPKEAHQTPFWVIIGVVLVDPNPKRLLPRLGQTRGRRARNRLGLRVGPIGINGKENSPRFIRTQFCKKRFFPNRPHGYTERALISLCGTCPSLHAGLHWLLPGSLPHGSQTVQGGR